MTYVASPPPGTITRVAAGSTGAPHVAANGGVVVWPQAKDGHMVIMKYDHGTVSQVSEDGYDCTNPALSADGSICIYSRVTPSHDGIEANFDIYKNEGGKNTPIATTPGNEFCNAISADGKVIAWDDDMGTNFGRWRVGKWQDGQTSFLTDGKIRSEVPFIANGSDRVFFVQSDSGKTRISGEQADGSIAPVVNDFEGMAFPDVTADGQTFTWSSHKDGFDLLKQFTVGSDVTVAASAPKTDYLWSNMSDDGTKTVWTAFNRDVPDPSHPDSAIIYRDGQQEYIMATNNGPVFPSMPQVSNDGKTITWFTIDGSKPDAVCEVFVYENGDAAPTPTPDPAPAPPTSTQPAAPSLTKA